MASSCVSMSMSVSLVSGLAGGMYQTMGMVRNSGCRGSASFQSLISVYTGEFRAAVRN